MKCNTRHADHPQATLWDILVRRDSRRALLENLSAYDAAKLDLAFGHFLDSFERDKFLNPIRDIFWNLEDTEVLLKEGMRIVLLGSGASLLEERLVNTKDYLKRYLHSHRLQIYIIGFFPLKDKTTIVLDKMVKLSLNGKISRSRVFRDKIHLRKLKQHLVDGSNEFYLMSFGAPTDLSKSDKRGAWQRVPGLPDVATDVHVYVPCYTDRIWKQVQIPFREIIRIRGCLSKTPSVRHTIENLVRICIGKYKLKDPAYLTRSGVSSRDLADELIIVDVRPAEFAAIDMMI